MVCAQWMTTFCDALIACLPASTIPLDSCPKQAHGNHLSTNSCPPRAADPDACYQKLVELKNGETFNGHLVNCDNFMNITLREVYQTSADGDRFWKLKECYIRGSTVRQPIPFFSPAFVWISQRRSWSCLCAPVNPTQPNPCNYCTRQIKYLRVPDTLLDAVKEEQARAREANRSSRGTGAGPRGGACFPPAPPLSWLLCVSNCHTAFVHACCYPRRRTAATGYSAFSSSGILLSTGRGAPPRGLSLIWPSPSHVLYAQVAHLGRGGMMRGSGPRGTRGRGRG